MVSAAAKQTAMGTAQTVDSLLRVNSEPGAQQYEIDTDAELVGGTEEMQDQEVSVRNYEMSISQNRCKPHTLATILASAMGSVTSATIAVSVWQHAITPKTARDFDLFTVEELITTGLQKQYADCFVDSFELSLERRNFWDISGTILGSGKDATGSASVTEKSESSMHTRFTKAWLSAGTYDGSAPTQDMNLEDLTGSPDVVSAEIESLRWSYNNNTDQDFLWHFNSGLTWGRAERGDRNQTISMTLLMTRTTALTRILNQTDLALQLKAVNTDAVIASTYYEGGSIILPKIRYTSVNPRGLAGGRMVFEIEGNVLEHATHGSALVWIWNGQTAYLA